MPLGVNVELDGGYARISFPDSAKRGEGLQALLKTGAPIDVRTGGRHWVYIVPEGNAREAGLLDGPRPSPQVAKSVPAPTETEPVEPEISGESLVPRTPRKTSTRKSVPQKEGANK